MTTAICLERSRGVVLDNVSIVGFEKGIYAKDSEFLVRNCYISENKIGIESVNSFGSIHNSEFRKNDIDLIVNRSSIHVVDTIAEKVMEITRNGSRIEDIEAHWIAFRIINATDPQEKRRLFRKLIEYSQYIGLIWTIYQILKESGILN
ncbi:hypothetical protein GAH_01649 [Geoglobus ahangari]|uniref:Uncharacterized protein n=1 Tax=Geoglobus ahangari TaxID=113653 RepID=A0A0F7ICQ0_9EURY|nr:hypothetical protein [Geoglobus ahangari]AKG91064.1 hypothetical protein GAH_01649 [Geoglobus ahangari]